MEYAELDENFDVNILSKPEEMDTTQSQIHFETELRDASNKCFQLRFMLIILL